jgi:hypothetical protein
MAIKQPLAPNKVTEIRRRKLTVVVGGRANHLYGSMSNPPRIWLDYRPVRIGWVVDDPSVAALAAAAHFNSCLWGGRFNPTHSLSGRATRGGSRQAFQCGRSAAGGQRLKRGELDFARRLGRID